MAKMVYSSIIWTITKEGSFRHAYAQPGAPGKNSRQLSSWPFCYRSGAPPWSHKANAFAVIEWPRWNFRGHGSPSRRSFQHGCRFLAASPDAARSLGGVAEKTNKGEGASGENCGIGDVKVAFRLKSFSRKA